MNRERIAVLTAASALVLFRAWVFIWWEQSHFDADQAVVGLMAKHLLEGRAFPLFFYGQQYLLGVESWLVAPFFLVAGVSIATLKLPLLLLNLVAVILLVTGLERFAGLRPWQAGLVSLFFIVPPPSAASRLVQANGCNIEPFVYVLLIWFLRHRPLWLGVVIGVGVLNREFTAYGCVALIVVELSQGRLFTTHRLRELALAGLVALGIWQGVQVLMPFASARGPGTSYAEIGVLSHEAEVRQRACWPDDIQARLTALGSAQLPEMFGARHQPLQRVGIVATSLQGVDGLWPLLAITGVLAAGRAAWLARSRVREYLAGPLAFPVFLILVGAQSISVYGITCGQRSHLTMRYMLLGLLLAVGLGAAYAVLEPRRWAARAALAVVAAWAVVSAASHFALLVEYVTAPPVAEYRILTNYLEHEQIRYARAAFWDAYTVTFLSNERVRVGSADLVRVEEYVRDFEQHQATAVKLSSSACPGTHVARWWVCPATAPVKDGGLPLPGGSAGGTGLRFGGAIGKD
jgi:hypothetical protein